MATKSSKKGSKGASSSSKKGANKRGAAAKPAEGAMLGRADLIIAPPPPQSMSIQIQPIPGPDSEDSIKCRTRSTLSLIPGIFKDIRTDNDPTDGRIRFTFVLNDSHAIYFFVPNCNPDGVFYLPELSSNIAFVEGPSYLNTQNTRIRFKLFPPNPLKVIPFTFAFRVKFEENFNVTQQFNPKKFTAKITVL
ncbi:MAG TPA: hypothetical protein VHU19_07770 [Pyrinomonadaceae bacterium]|jgi:hypothetical protein|nr:hypothetical protein [Pyrinomonadaceae bacterium]